MRSQKSIRKITSALEKWIQDVSKQVIKEEREMANKLMKNIKPLKDKRNTI